MSERTRSPGNPALSASAATSAAAAGASAYTEVRPAQSVCVVLRGIRHHLRCWGDPSLVTASRPALFMLHGWMDVGASFQFLVDALDARRYIVAPDWRGFGLSHGETSAPADSYWFPDYLADLDALLSGAVEGIGADTPIDLAGHSMGGNVAMLYAGVRPDRVRRLVNLEGFGMPDTRPDQAPDQYRRWLDQLRKPATLRSYPDLESVAALLRRNDPLLKPERAEWLARHWAFEKAPGVWELRADPAHKHPNPILYRAAEALACWRRIVAPVLWIDGDQTDILRWWGNRYSRSEFDERLGVVAHVERHTLSPSGHMLHHDQPEQAATLIDAFLDRS